jgi:2',3'-cyclic-nucleotide 2'-phosphodiesterase (5'-nucleotidase family)
MFPLEDPMRRPVVLATATLALVLAACDPTPPVAPATLPDEPAVVFAPIGRYSTGLGTGSAEISTYADGRAYLVNATENALDIVDLSDPTEPTLVERVDLDAYGSAVNSVDVHDDVVAVALQADPKTDPGTVAFLSTDGDLLGSETVGALPDMVTFTPDGAYAISADEGEPNDAYTIDPQGTVSIIDVADALAAEPGATRTVDFTAYDAGGALEGTLPKTVRVYGPGASPSEDFEPEYVGVSPDGSTAYVTLQENNAVAVIDIADAELDRIDALGSKDHLSPGNGLDPSDRDNTIAVANWPVRGLFQPDTIAVTELGGKRYYVTANEGDTRDYAGYSEERRVGAGGYVLAPEAFPNGADLKQNAKLGRLTATTASGDLDKDGDFDQITVPGARSFTIRDAATGKRVWDSGQQFEDLTALIAPATFNSDGGVANFDTRSDNKGPEPEALAIGEVDGRTYAFIGLERSGGVMIYDITNPKAPTFVQYTNPPQDQAPEHIEFISAADSPSGTTMFLVANEVSGTLTVYEATDPDGAGTLTLLHNNDGESTISPLTYNAAGTQLPVAGVAAYSSVVQRERAEGRSAGNSVLNVYAGDAFLASTALKCSLPPNPDTTPIYDAVAQRLMGYDAHIFGNHEFDYSPDFLEKFVRQSAVNGVASEPFLSGNLDFSGESGFDDLVESDGIVVGAATSGKVVAKSAILTDRVTGARFGIVSATTPTLPAISSPRNVALTSSDLATTATLLQGQIDDLSATYGVTKTILVSHLQAVANDIDLIELVTDVDIAVAGGGDDLLANSTGELLPGEAQAIQGTYPLPVTDAEGQTTYVVTTAGNYKYLGRLDATFDAAGEITSIGADSGPVRVVPTSAAATTLGVTDAVTPDARVQTQAVAPVDACVAALSNPFVDTEVLFDTSNPGQRTRESNTGNSVADSYLAAYDAYAVANGLAPRGPANPVIAVQNGGGIRQNAGNVLPTTGIAPGSISKKNTGDVLAFFNTMAVTEGIDPAELKAIMEWSVSSLPTANGKFLQIGGFEITYDATKPAQKLLGVAPNQTIDPANPGERIRSITLDDGTPIVVDGEIVSGAPTVSIVTNRFTAEGGDAYVTLRDNTDRTELFGTGGVILTYEQAWVDYLASFPVGTSGRPTIPASDGRYAATTGEGRITAVTPTP